MTINSSRGASPPGKLLARRGFTLVELLVVITIISLIAGMLLPAVSAVRETARKAVCANNMRQIGLAVLNFESSNRTLPSGGVGTQYWTQSAATAAGIFQSVNAGLSRPPALGSGSTGTAATCTEFDAKGLSLFTQLLPYMDAQLVYNKFNLSKLYNDTNCPANQAAAKTIIPSYLCPSDPYPQRDPQGYARLDYFATTYSDVSPVDAPACHTSYHAYDRDNRGSNRLDGALCVPAISMASVKDGVTNTLLCIEDAGRIPTPYVPGDTAGTLSRHAAPTLNPDGTTPALDDTAATTPCDPTALPAPSAPCRAVWRWADADAGGSGISGQGADIDNANVPGLSGSADGHRARFVNGNNSPLGGPRGDGTSTAFCPWYQNNCGPNNQPFSFHAGGVNAVFADAAVHFLSNDIDGIVLRRLTTRAEGLTPDGQITTTRAISAGAAAVTAGTPNVYTPALPQF